MPSNRLILCGPLLLLPSVFPNIRVFSNESALCIRWPKYWSFNFNISPSNEHPGLISFRMDWLVGSPCSPRDSVHKVLIKKCCRSPEEGARTSGKRTPRTASRNLIWSVFWKMNRNSAAGGGRGPCRLRHAEREGSVCVCGGRRGVEWT